MIKKLTSKDIDQVAKLHQRELSGFLSELGEDFLKKFYKVGLETTEMFTYVYKNDEQILGFVQCATNTKGLYKKIIVKEPVGFGLIFLRYFVTHPRKLVKTVKTLFYPGFKSQGPELLTIAVKKKYQNRGIGTKLIRTVIKEFKLRRIKKFRTSVYEQLPANKFYQKIGFKFEKSFDFLGEKMNYYVYEI